MRREVTEILTNGYGGGAKRTIVVGEYDLPFFENDGQCHGTHYYTGPVVELPPLTQEDIDRDNALKEKARKENSLDNKLAKAKPVKRKEVTTEEWKRRGELMTGYF